MIVILGGTFDPIHVGHLAIATQANHLLQPNKVLFMPCKQPVHKAKSDTNSDHRINMLKLAIAEQPNFQLDLREINRHSASYAVESLQSLRQENGKQPLFFVIGMDSLNKLHTWHKWQTCLQYANFLVFKRPGELFQPNDAVKNYVIGDIENFQHHPCPFGRIFLADHQQVAISSSEIRQADFDSHNNFLPNAVCDYIKHHRLYQ